MTLSLALYKRLMGLAHAFAPRLLNSRVTKGKEDPLRFRERLGETQTRRPTGEVVWIHGVSVGESLSALPVIERLRAQRPDLTVLITTATTTSAEILARRLPSGAIHQFAPIDTPQAVAAFLDHWRPGLAIFIESDIWPNLLGALSARQIPRALISARITEKTWKGWQRFRASMEQLLSGYSLIMAQDQDSEDRLWTMGELTFGPQANLKTIGAPLAVDTAALATLKDSIDGRFVILAASTHSGEDGLIARSLMTHMANGDLLILVPRHPIRAGDIRLDMEALGLAVAQRSKAEPITPDTQVYLADTLGELGVFFTLADMTIMGGSFLTGIGGHNPMEPARLGKCVITGPDISNWLGIFSDLLAADAGFKVKGPDELTFVVQQLRAHPAAIRTADEKARIVSRAEDRTLDTVWDALAPLLPGAVHGH